MLHALFLLLFQDCILFHLQHNGSVPNVSMLDGGAGDQDRSMGITGMDILF
jgi:hypothetical protein